MNVEYNMAISEVLSILNDFDKTEIKKIPQSFITFLKRNADTTYTPDFDKAKEIKDLNLKKETKGLLSLIYKSYLCKGEEKKIYFDNLLRENCTKKEKEEKEKFDINKVFASRQNVINLEGKFDKDETNLIQYKKETLFIRIINKIKNWFKRRK